jgi:hypothetical protein
LFHHSSYGSTNEKRMTLQASVGQLAPTTA